MCSTTEQDKDLPVFQAGIANMGVMFTSRMTNAGRVPLGNPNAICGEVLFVARSASGLIAAGSGPFWPLLCPLQPIDFYNEGLLLPAPSSSWHSSYSLRPAWFFFFFVGKGSMEIPGAHRGKAICKVAVTALAKQALPRDNVYVSWPISSCFS